MGDSGHPKTRQTHRNALHVPANSTDAKPRAGSAPRCRSHGSAMAGGGCVLCYVVLGRRSTKWRHGEVESLTASLTAVVTASRRPPKGQVNGGRNLEREHGSGEVESEELKVKTRNRRYLLLRGDTAEVTDASATRSGHRSNELRRRPVSVSADREKGRRRGRGSGFIDGWARRTRKGERAAITGLSMQVRRRL